MEFGPDAGTRPPRQQTDAFAAVRQGQHEQPGPPVLARLRVAYQRATAVIDLGFFPRRGEDDPRCPGAAWIPEACVRNALRSGSYPDNHDR
jgi:hypothetical protein